MKDPKAMSLAEVRAELRYIGVTQRYIGFLLRELDEVGKRATDIPFANWNVFRAHKMTTKDGELNRKGKLIVELANRDPEAALAASETKVAA